MRFLLLIAFCLTIIGTVKATECEQLHCPWQTQCTETANCNGDLCVPFTCASDLAVCVDAVCPQNTLCIPEPKQCVTTPCPQYACLPVPEIWCAANACPQDSVCVSEPKQCFTTPCPQYGCRALSDCPDICTDDYAPVCGTNGQTFSNLCALKAAVCSLKLAIDVAHEGECAAVVEEDDCDVICPMIFEPVCGSDGATYENECKMSVAACKTKATISVLYAGECAVCEESCVEIYEPVCSSDLNTYSNECMMNMAACLTKSTLSVLYAGECAVCDAVCPFNYDPVCGTDGVTYSNGCVLSVAACKTKSSISVQSTGECAVCDEMCTETFEPVCGSDGNTYSNECMLKVAACKTKSAITVQTTGECTNCAATLCPLIYSPRCGSDMITYSNECMMSVATCNSKGVISELHAGTCVTQQTLKQFDTNHNGQISHNEFAAANPTLTQEQLDAAFQTYDLNGDGVIDNQDFALSGDSAPSSTVNNSVIIGGAIGACVGILGIAIVAFFIYKSKTQSANEAAKDEALLAEDNNAFDSRIEVN